jgi:hypothetical protein
MINQQNEPKDEKTTSDQVNPIDSQKELEQHVTQRDGKWMLVGFGGKLPVQLFNPAQTYDSREQALEAARNVLQGSKAAA